MTTDGQISTTCRDHGSCDVLGRLMMAIRGTWLAEVTLNYRMGLDGTVVVEWAHGPTAEEARQYLVDTAVASDGLDVLADDLAVNPGRVHPTADGRVHVLMRGVPVEFCEHDPIGQQAFQEALLATWRSTSSRPAAPSAN